MDGSDVPVGMTRDSDMWNLREPLHPHVLYSSSGSGGRPRVVHCEISPNRKTKPNTASQQDKEL